MPQIRRTTILWIAAWAATVPVALARAGLLAESDTFWEIRTGQVILATGRIPRTDPFSWTAYGRPWRPNSWGFDVLLAPAYRYGGLTAVALLGAVLVLLVVAAMLVLARRLGAGPGPPRSCCCSRCRCWSPGSRYGHSSPTTRRLPCCSCSWSGSQPGVGRS